VYKVSNSKNGNQMSFLKFAFKKTALIDEESIKKIGERLIPEIEHIQDEIGNGYATEYGSVNVPFDQQLNEHVLQLAKQKESLKPTALVVIGIGGSNLGTVAIQEALYGKFYNQKNPPIKIYFADTVDQRYIDDIKQLVRKELERDHTVLLNVVTKSGTTTETIKNFETFLSLIKEYRPNEFNKSMIVTTDAASSLAQRAKNEDFNILNIPKDVGGRYSVFSAAGQFPLSLIGIDTNELLKGAREAVNVCTQSDVLSNPAAVNAIIKYAHYQKGMNINDMFLFSVELESVGKWYRQLMGESIGKEFNIKGEREHVGITPTVSIGTTDLHSVGQLYLGGPYDKFTTFVSIADKKDPSLMNIILQGVQTAYQKNKRPFCSIELPALTPYYIGQLLQMYMLEMIYLGYLFEVDPFDQPNVELYKQEVRKILS